MTLEERAAALERRSAARAQRRAESEARGGAESDRDGGGPAAPAGGPGSAPADGVRHAAKRTAAAVALGAAVGVARALASRDGDDGDEERNGVGAPTAPVAEEEEPRDDEEAERPEAEREQHDEEPEQEQPDEPEGAEEPEERRLPQADASPEVDARPGLTGRDAERMVERARGYLLALQGREAESVSGLSRSPAGWLVSLEVLELRRVPDSTDVLATYELELDDDENLVRLERTRRYHRSQADRGEGW